MGLGMNKYINGFLMGICLLLLMAFVDKRNQSPRYPVAKYSTTELSWATGDANAASTTLYNLNGIIERIDFTFGDACDTPPNYATVSLIETISSNNYTLCYFTDLSSYAGAFAHQRYTKLATSDATDFDAIPFNGNLLIQVDPNVGPTGSTFTATIDIYMR